MFVVALLDSSKLSASAAYCVGLSVGQVDQTCTAAAVSAGDEVFAALYNSGYAMNSNLNRSINISRK